VTLGSKEGVDSLVGASDGGSGFFDAQFDNICVAFKPESERCGASTGLGQNRFSNDVAIGGEHRWPLIIKVDDLAHEASMADAFAFFLGATVAVGITMVPLGAHYAPQQ
jgi:hypothetical protein